jgi:hypothetical protein
MPMLTLGGVPADIGAGLQRGSFRVFLGFPAPAGGRTIRVESLDQDRARVSLSASTPGAQSIDLTVNSGTTFTNEFFVEGVAGAMPGTAMLRATTDGYTDAMGTVNVVQPALEIVGLSSDITTLDVNDPFQIRVGLPTVGNPPNGVSSEQVVRAGGTLTVMLNNSNPQAGRLVPATDMAGRMATVQIMERQAISPADAISFDPLTTDTTTVSATIAGFIATQRASVTLTDSTPGIRVLGPPFGPGGAVPLAHRVGAGLQLPSLLATLGASNHGGVTIRLTSSNPAVAQVSRDSATPGTDFIDIDVPNGSTTVQFVAQGRENATGAVAIIASAPGFTDGSGVITVVPPALQFSGLASSIDAEASSDQFQVVVGIPRTNSPFLDQTQSVRSGGSPLTVTVTSSVSTVGQLMTTAAGTAATVTVQINPGEIGTPGSVSTGGVAFVPAGPGSTLIRATLDGSSSGAATQQVIVFEAD